MPLPTRVWVIVRTEENKKKRFAGCAYAHNISLLSFFRASFFNTRHIRGSFVPFNLTTVYFIVFIPFISLMGHSLTHTGMHFWSCVFIISSCNLALNLCIRFDYPSFVRFCSAKCLRSTKEIYHKQLPFISLKLDGDKSHHKITNFT